MNKVDFSIESMICLTCGCLFGISKDAPLPVKCFRCQKIPCVTVDKYIEHINKMKESEATNQAEK